MQHDVLTQCSQSTQSGLKNLGKETEVVVEEFIRLQDSIQQTLASPENNK